MPVLGGTGGASGVRGIRTPGGSLDVWKAARAAHATDRPEVVFLGDSTWWGQVSAADASPGSNLYSVNNRSPIAKIRELSIAAGYTDGGPGVVGLFDSAQSLALAVDPVDRGYTAEQGGAGANLLQQYSPKLSVTETVTYRCRTSQARIVCNRAGDSGSFTYSVNGAAAVTVTPGTTGGYTTTVVTGMTAGVDNTIVFTNVSGNNRIDVEFINATGIVYHKNCVPGATVANFIATPDEAASATNLMLQAILGTSGAGVASAAAEGTHPAARKVRLAIFVLGINDINTISGQTSPRNDETYLQSANLFIQTARNAGADPVICIPHWKVNPSQYFTKAGAMMASDLGGLALANGCALVDTNEALGGSLGKWAGTSYGSGDAHLTRAGYDLIGQFLWDNIINAA